MNENDSELYIEGDKTEPTEVLDFVAERTAGPMIFRGGDVVVYNYHNRDVVVNALVEWAESAEPGVYVVPYQVSGVWAFMQRVLPQEVRDADLLTYRRRDDQYVDYENWRRIFDESDEEFEDAEVVHEQIDEIHRTAMKVLLNV